MRTWLPTMMLLAMGAAVFFPPFLAAAPVHPPAPVRAEAGEPAPEISGTIPLRWAAKKTEGAYWSVAAGDVDGDGQGETLLLSRRRVLIGAREGSAFREEAVCELPGDVEGAKISTVDLDGDGKEEIAVSAVEDGRPASAILSLEGKICRPLVSRAPWSLRVLELPGGGKRLAGQRWSLSSFFFGPVVELGLAGGKLEAKGEALLPRGTRLFQFERLSSGGEEGSDRVARLKGYDRLEVHELRGKKFKRIWRSAARLGGSANQLAAPQRDVLDERSSDVVFFDLPPVAVQVGGREAVLVVAHHVPLRGIVGRKYGISGSRVAIFAEDPLTGFALQGESPDLSGCVVDLARDPEGTAVALLQNECGLFENATESQIVGF